MTGGLEPGVVTVLAPGVRRIVAPNPGPMTGPGTNTYLLGEREVAVIDPGPYVEGHVDAIRAAAPGPIRWVIVTHTHRDHSPAAQALREATGAARVGRLPPPGPRQDRRFVPDIGLEDGERVTTDEFALRAVHTPGHASNHLCYLLEDSAWLFTGDHIMNGSTVVIDPPDGDMAEYLDSLGRLRGLDLRMLAPGHGELIDDARGEIDWIIAHRLEREARLIAALSDVQEKTEDELVVEVYDEIDPHLHPIALRTLLAHLIKLDDEGRVRDTGSGWILDRAEA